MNIAKVGGVDDRVNPRLIEFGELDKLAAAVAQNPADHQARLDLAIAQFAAGKPQGPGRLKALRGKLKEMGLAGFIVPRADAHQGEYVAPCDERLQWLTGFSGSAGFAVVTKTTADFLPSGGTSLIFYGIME